MALKERSLLQLSFQHTPGSPQGQVQLSDGHTPICLQGVRHLAWHHTLYICKLNTEKSENRGRKCSTIVIAVNSSPSAPRRHIERTEVQLHPFLTSARDWQEWSTSRRGHFTRGTEPWYPHWIVDALQRWCGCSADEKYLLPLLEFKPRTVRPVA
jgi:hypothetical protein